MKNKLKELGFELSDSATNYATFLNIPSYYSKKHNAYISQYDSLLDKDLRPKDLYCIIMKYKNDVSKTLISDSFLNDVDIDIINDELLHIKSEMKLNY